MRKTALFGLLAIPLAFLLSACFVLQGFWIVANSIAPGGKTKAVFELHAASTTSDNAHQFFLVGVADIDDLTAGKATWGANGTYGGPYPLPVSANLETVIGTDCDSNGFELSAITGITWKGFITPTPINDRNKVNKNVIVQVGLRSPDTASAGDEAVLGVTGAWVDDGDGVPESGDIFYCTGFTQAWVTVTA